jgi:hypothetical protein
MAFRLSKDELKTRDEHASKLGRLATEIETAMEAYNSATEAPRAEVEKAIEVYNEAASEARDFVEGVAARIQEEMDERSDRWREGDKGEAAAAWLSEWEALSINDIEIELPQGLNFEDPDHAGQLEQAPEEA